MANKLSVKMNFIPDPRVCFYDILDHRIQQPIRKLRILDFHKFANQSVFDETPPIKTRLVRIVQKIREN